MNMNFREHHHVIFLLVPDFDILSFSFSLEILRVTNVAIGYEAYTWRLVSSDGCDVKSSCGLNFQVVRSVDMERVVQPGSGIPSAIVICSGLNVTNYQYRSVHAWLRECGRHGVVLIGLSSAARILADAGLLEGRKCAIHWQNYPAFSEENGFVSVSSSIYEIDGNIYTSAGATACLDVMANLIRKDFGESVLARVCQYLVADRIRAATTRQRLPLSRRTAPCSEVVLEVVRKMEANLTDPIRISDLAVAVRLSRRQLERHFRSQFGCSPGKYYVGLRLENANLLLAQTRMPIVEISVACGFVSASHFSKVYRQVYGCSPRNMRIGQSIRQMSKDDNDKVPIVY